MRFISLFLLAFGIPCMALASSATVFPPSGCSEDEERIITWKDGSTTTYCRTGQEILNMAIHPCKDGEHVVFHENDGSGRIAVGAEGTVKISGEFVCEPNPADCAEGEAITIKDGKLTCVSISVMLKPKLYVKHAGMAGAKDGAGSPGIVACDDGDTLISVLEATCTSDNDPEHQAWVESFGVWTPFTAWPSVSQGYDPLPTRAYAACDNKNDELYDGGGVAVLCLKH